MFQVKSRCTRCKESATFRGNDASDRAKEWTDAHVDKHKNDGNPTIRD